MKQPVPMITQSLRALSRTGIRLNRHVEEGDLQAEPDRREIRCQNRILNPCRRDGEGGVHASSDSVVSNHWVDLLLLAMLRMCLMVTSIIALILMRDRFDPEPKRIMELQPFLSQ
jgi:hypothetical protein